MCATVPKHELPETILLFDVPWEAYEGLIDALPEHRIRHTYDRGTLELFRNVLFDVPWEAYEKILDAFGDRRFPHTYQDGTLEIMMSPSRDHERIKSFLGRVIETACLELGVHFEALGSTTQRDPKLMQGLEPDESYCFSPGTTKRKTSARRTSAKSLADLVIEVDLRKPEAPRMRSYEKLGVRELWRYRKGKVEFFKLVKGKYKLTDASLAFPAIGSEDLTRYVHEMHETDDYTATQSFLSWFRKKCRKQ